MLSEDRSPLLLFRPGTKARGHFEAAVQSHFYAGVCLPPTADTRDQQRAPGVTEGSVFQYL